MGCHKLGFSLLSAALFLLSFAPGARAQLPAVEVDTFVNSECVVELVLPGGTRDTVWMAGRSVMRVNFDDEQEGSAYDDDRDGLDEVQTEIVELDLAGWGWVVGPARVRLNGDFRSAGEIEEATNSTVDILDVPPFASPGIADSFFDVFFEIDVPDGTLHNDVPARLSGVITHKPPGPLDVYQSPGDIPLLNATGNPTGYFLGAVRYRPNPVVEVDVFEHSECDLELWFQGGLMDTVWMVGPSAMRIFFEGAVEGSAHDDGDNAGLDEVQAEMTQLDLRGFSPMAGPIRMNLDPNFVAVGSIEELTNANSGILDVPPFALGGTALSVFYVHVEMDVGGQKMYGREYMGLGTQITHKPPGPLDIYQFGGPVELVTAQGNPTGIVLGITRYRPNPSVEVDVFKHSECDLELLLPDGSTENVWMAGESTMRVFFEGAVEGSADDDDRDLRDEVEAEMTQLNLRGLSPLLGPIRVGLNTSLPSLGVIEETADASTGVLDVPPFALGGTADSFFDVYVEIEMAGQRFHTSEPMHMSARITRKPPAPLDIYESLVDVELRNEQGNPTGYFLGATRYRPNPPVELDVFTSSKWQLELITPTGPEMVQMAGHSTMRVFFERDLLGSANDDDRDSRDEVRTELTELNLGGFSPALGPVLVRLSTSMPSFGEIEETDTNVPGVLEVPPFVPFGTADSFFDVFFEIEVGGETFHNGDPKHLTSVIAHKPPAPGEVYEDRTVVELLNVHGSPTGYSAGPVTYEPNVSEPLCGDAEHPYPEGDLNFDCEVNDLDLIILQQHWKECTKPECEE